MVIYCIDKADKTKEQTRKVITDFLKESLGFKDKNIIFVDRTEFIGDFKNGIYQTKFSEETKEAMKIFARPIFGEKEYPLANQVLNMAICET